MVKRSLLILIILCSLLFFEFTFLGKFSKLLELAGVGLIILVIIIYSIYDSSFRFKHHFSPFIIMIFIALPLSMYVADRFHNQPMNISLYAQRSIYYYLLYFALHKIKIKPDELEKMFIIFGIAFILLYFLQYALYSKIILFNTTIGKERGTVRIFLAGIPYLLILYYYSLQKFLEKQHLKFALLLLPALTIIILIGSRFLIFTTAFITSLNLILSKRIKSKLLIYIITVVGIAAIYLTFQNIFEELIKITLQKGSDSISSENIRIRAVKYFLSRFFPNTLSYIFGNGAYGSQSEYTRTLEMISSMYGYFIADIGIIGNYVNYGILFVVAVIGIIYKYLRSKIQPRYYYIKYFYAFTAISIIMGGGFADSDFIVLVCLTLYIMDVSKFYLKKDNEEPGRDNTPDITDSESEDDIQEDRLAEKPIGM